MGGLCVHVRSLQKNVYIIGLYAWENMYTHLSAVGGMFCLGIDW
jgi:hypothetical protein